MLFSSGETISSQQRLVQKLQQYLAASDQNVDGELYLLVDFSRGEHRCYEFRVPHHGKLKANEIEFLYLERLSGPDVNRVGSTTTS
jgi:hypothetical protein